MFVDTVAFPAYRKETIQKAGLFDEELVRNQDDEYNYRLRSLGGKILMSTAIRSRYYSRSSYKSLFKQYYQYGYWKVRVMQKHPHQMSLRQFIPPVFVASLVFLSILAPFFGLARYLLAVEVGLYLITNLTASILAIKKNPVGYIPGLMLAFLMLHLSYGLGFIAGLFKFANRWSSPSNDS
jgi:succinoglycan biosynthesis protein ExoA